MNEDLLWNEGWSKPQLALQHQGALRVEQGNAGAPFRSVLWKRKSRSNRLYMPRLALGAGVAGAGTDAGWSP
jgi:hypothetical protein